MDPVARASIAMIFLQCWLPFVCGYCLKWEPMMQRGLAIYAVATSFFSIVFLLAMRWQYGDDFLKHINQPIGYVVPAIGFLASFLFVKHLNKPKTEPSPGEDQ